MRSRAYQDRIKSEVERCDFLYRSINAAFTCIYVLALQADRRNAKNAGKERAEAE